MIFNVAKIRHFAIEKISSNLVKGTFWKIYKKKIHFSKIFLKKLSIILEDLAQISSFLLLKSPYFS